MNPPERAKQLAEKIVAVISETIESAGPDSEHLGHAIFFGMSLAAASVATMMGVSLSQFRAVFNKTLDGLQTIFDDESPNFEGQSVEPPRVVVTQVSPHPPAAAQPAGPDPGGPVAQSDFLSGIDLDAYDPRNKK
jgi:hypothetical protein